MGKISEQLLALNAEKHAIRDAINRKGGELTKGSPLADYPAAIDAIKTGDVLPAAPENDYFRVLFIDYDGAVLKDVMVRRGSAVLPPDDPAPREHLTFLGWNRTEDDLANVQHDMCVGARYEVEGIENHSNWLYLTVTAGQRIRIDGRSISGSYWTVDWGDGNVEELNGDGIHTYAAAGEVIVRTQNRSIKLDYSTSSSTDYYWTSTLKKAYLNALSGLNDSSRHPFTVLEEVCIGVGALVPAASTAYILPAMIKGFVLNETTVRAVSALKFVGKFYFSGNPDGYFFLNLPGSNAASPVVELFPGGAINSGGATSVERIVVPPEINALTSSGSHHSEHICLTGSAFRGGYLTKFRTILIENGAVPMENTFIDFALLENANEFLNALGEVEEALTITLSHVNTYSGLRDEISALLTAKGYTVAFN